MEQIEVSHIDASKDRIESDILPLQDDLLQVLRIRAYDPNVRRISHLRLPRAVMTDPEIQEELER